MFEEAENLVARRARGLALAVDQVERHDAVRFHGRARVRGRIGDYARDETIPERSLISRKALGAAERIAREAIREHGQVFALHACLHLRELVRRDLHARAVPDRE